MVECSSSDEESFIRRTNVCYRYRSTRPQPDRAGKEGPSTWSHTGLASTRLSREIRRANVGRRELIRVVLVGNLRLFARTWYSSIFHRSLHGVVKNSVGNSVASAYAGREASVREEKAGRLIPTKPRERLASQASVSATRLRLSKSRTNKNVNNTPPHDPALLSWWKQCLPGRRNKPCLGRSNIYLHWSVQTRRAPFRHGRDARVYGLVWC